MRLITCEHGGNEVPDELQDRFASRDAALHLNSHRGYDPGALLAARRIAQAYHAPLEFSTVSRLVVDLNRSLDSAELFSKFVDNLDSTARQQILAVHYHPYRDRIASLLQAWPNPGTVLHLSIHTFTPRYRGLRRRLDVGVLFDPARKQERGFGLRVVDQLTARGFRALANEPYEGTADGLTTTLRKRFADDRYAGIELEINNRFARLSVTNQEKWCQRIIAALDAAS